MSECCVLCECVDVEWLCVDVGWLCGWFCDECLVCVVVGGSCGEMCGGLGGIE